MQNMKYVYPENAKVRCLEINYRDLITLRDQEYANDNIVGYRSMCIRDWQQKAHERGEGVKIHFLTSFFFTKLTEDILDKDLESVTKNSVVKDLTLEEKTEAARYNRVKNWTRDVDIFEYDYIIVPIHMASHWSVAIICQPGARPPN